MAEENILEMDLAPEQEELLREALEGWKEEVYANILEEVEVLKEQKIEELEEANIEYREDLKKEMADKFVIALKELREEVKAEAVAEVLSSNPELQIFESIKELIAPTLNEDFIGNIYAEEIQTLHEENLALKEEFELEEGARTLADLISPYSEQTQNILLAVIKEGGPEEVTEQFYNLIESMELAEADDDDEEVDDEEDEDEDKDVKPKKGDFDSDEEYEKALKAWEKAQEDEDDDDEEEDEDENEDFDEYHGSYIHEDEEDEDTKQTKVNELRSRITDLAE